MSDSEYSPPLVSPRRIQRRRSKGWRMPDGAVYVGRPTRWGNPFASSDRARDVREYAEWLTRRPDIVEAARRELRGKDLACWCPESQPCHADVLLRVANMQLYVNEANGREE